ncbi:MAG: hypothetical protein R3D71_05295 [Rickettsiales bacterium]
MRDKEDRKAGVPADGANMGEQIHYIKSNFGKQLLEDLSAAAKSGTIPEALKNFLEEKYTYTASSTTGTVVRQQDLNASSLFGGEHDAFSPCMRSPNTIENNYNYSDIIGLENSLLEAIKTGNIDFISAFTDRGEKESSAIYQLATSDNDLELPFKMVKVAIEKKQIKMLEKLLDSDVYYFISHKRHKISIPKDKFYKDKLYETEGDNRVFRLITENVASNPDIVHSMLTSKNVVKDAQTEIADAEDRMVKVAGIKKEFEERSIPTRPPKINQRIAGAQQKA